MTSDGWEEAESRGQEAGKSKQQIARTRHTGDSSECPWGESSSDERSAFAGIRSGAIRRKACLVKIGEEGVGEVAGVLQAGMGVGADRARGATGCGGGRGKLEDGLESFAGFIVVAELRVEIAEQQKKFRILRVALHEGLGDFKRFLIFLIVLAKRASEDETDVDVKKHTASHAVFHLLDADLFVAAGNSHKDAQKLHDGGKGVDVVVVEAEGGGGVGILGVDVKSTKHFGPGRDSRVSRVAIFAANAVDTRLEGPTEPCVDVHSSRVGFLELSLGEFDGAVSEGQIRFVGGFFGVLPGFDHAVLDFGGGAIALPPFGLGFQQKTERVIWLGLFERTRGEDGSSRIAGIQKIAGVNGFCRKMERSGEQRRGV